MSNYVSGLSSSDTRVSASKRDDILDDIISSFEGMRCLIQIFDVDTGKVHSSATVSTLTPKTLLRWCEKLDEALRSDPTTNEVVVDLSSEDDASLSINIGASAARRLIGSEGDDERGSFLWSPWLWYPLGVLVCVAMIAGGIVYMATGKAAAIKRTIIGRVVASECAGTNTTSYRRSSRRVRIKCTVRVTYDDNKTKTFYTTTSTPILEGQAYTLYELADGRITNVHPRKRVSAAGGALVGCGMFLLFLLWLVWLCRNRGCELIWLPLWLYAY